MCKNEINGVCFCSGCDKNKPHKHAALIKLWADGAKIQWRRGSNGTWINVDGPAWVKEYEYRVKPEPKTIKYRVALFKYRFARADSWWVSTADNEKNAEELEKLSTFVKWITDWQTIVVEEA